MLPTSCNTSSCENPSPFMPAGRVATFQNPAMFWEQKKTATFSRMSFDTAWVACGPRAWFGCALRRRDVRIDQYAHQYSRPSYMASRLTA